MQSPETPPRKPPNSFQLLGSVLAACGGIRGNSARGRGFAEASLGSILGALLIFCAVMWAGGYAFIHAIKSAVAN
ncbi:hypothetical protein [Hydrocarboniphaga sp.]|uniref:hypothetical protein n=1 Tax=Hydrocarboniphaga sp. TaxID=2033016 RepID=UPI003D0A7E23